MKKLLFLLFLLPFMAMAQVSTGQEQYFDYGIKNNSSQKILTPDTLVTKGVDGTYGHTSAYRLPVSTATQAAIDVKVASNAGLQNAYNFEPKIVTSAIKGAVTLKRGSAADSDNILVGQNGAGTNTFTVTGAGNITGGAYNGYTPENVANKSDSYTVSSSTTYASTKALVDGLATKAPISGASNYIQNQNSSPQSANMWISGKGTFYPTANGLAAISLGQTGVSNGIIESPENILFNVDSDNNGVTNNNFYFGKGLDGLGGGTTFMTLFGTGAATFASTVTASNGTLIGGTLTSGYIPKATGANRLGNSLIYDNGTYVGIGTTSPTQKLHIGGVGSAIAFDTTGATGSSMIQTVEDYKLSLKSNRGGTTEIKIGDSNLEFLTNGAERMRIASGGNVLIGTTTDNGYKLNVSGSGRFSTGVNIADSESYSFGGASVKVIGNAVANVMDIQTNNTSALFLSATQVPRFSALSGTGTRAVVADASGNLSATIDLATKANLDSPSLTGTPTAPTATAGTNTTQVATTAFVQSGFVPQIKITTTTSITTETVGSVTGLGQQGRNVVIDNGANVINLTVNGTDGFCASYLKHGTGNITFVQGSGRTLIQVDGTAVLSGAVGSTATISSVGTTDYLMISNK